MAAAKSYSLVVRLRARWNEFAENRRGLAAVEFALIAAPFFFMIFGLLEVCLIFIMSTVLEHAVSEAARPLRTGEAQEAGMTDVQFRTSLCNELFDILDCDARLSIDVRTVANFGSTPIGAPIDGDGNLENDEFIFQPGGPNDIIAVRAFYEWTLITPLMSKPLANMAGDRHLLQANAVFRNEPFGS